MSLIKLRNIPSDPHKFFTVSLCVSFSSGVFYFPIAFKVTSISLEIPVIIFSGSIISHYIFEIFIEVSLAQNDLRENRQGTSLASARRQGYILTTPKLPL